jgi:hypothetical protein
MGFEIDDEDLSGQLVAAKLQHTIDLIRNEIDGVKTLQLHYEEFTDHRLARLEEDVRDHEQRLREATDGVTQFKTFHTLASGGSSFLSFLALIKSFFLP